MTAIDTLRSGIARTAERLTEDARSRNGAAFVIAGVLGLLAPVLVGGYTLDLVMQLIILILVVTSWIFIAGYFGMFSFAHAALYGIGAYAAVLLAGEMGIHPIIAVLLGGVVAGILSIPIALPVLRLSGAYVGMVTLAFAEIVYRLVIVFREVTGGPTGYTGFPSLFGGNRIALYYFVFALVAALACRAVRAAGQSLRSRGESDTRSPRRSADAREQRPEIQTHRIHNRVRDRRCRWRSTGSHRSDHLATDDRSQQNDRVHGDGHYRRPPDNRRRNLRSRDRLSDSPRDFVTLGKSDLSSGARSWSS